MADPTPGPWRIGFTDGSGATMDDREGAWILGPTDRDIIVQGGRSFGGSYGVMRREDARLIVAAPSLLEALERICAEIGYEHEGQLNDFYGVTDALRVIREARGEVVPGA